METSASARPAPLGLAIVAEIAGGIVVGAVLAVVLGFGIALILSWTPIAEQLGMGLLLVQLYSAVLGFGIGSALGIWLVGRYLRQGGNLWLALLGAIIGTMLDIVIVLSAGFGRNQAFVVTLLVLIPFVLTLLGYNLRRRPA